MDLRASEVTDLVIEGLSFLVCTEQPLCDSAAQSSTSLHTPDFIRPQR